MWKTCYQNLICQTQEQNREQNQHIERLFCIKPVINSTEPYKPKFLKEKMNHNQVLKDDIENKINYENNIIETRKSEIIYKDGQYSKTVCEPKLYPAFDGFNNRKREELNNKIDLSNLKFYWKINTLRPNYSREKMIKEAKDQEKYLKNILKRPKSIPYRPALNFLSIEQIKARLEKQLALNLLYRQQLEQDLINNQQNNNFNNNTNSNNKNKSKSSRKGSSAKKSKGGSRKNTEGGGNSLNKSKRSQRSQSSKNRKSLKINEGGEIEENGKKKSINTNGNNGN